MERNHKRLYSKLKQFEKLGFMVEFYDNNTVMVWHKTQEEGFPPFVEVRNDMLTLRTWLCGTNDEGEYEPYIERVIGICEGFIL